MKLLLLLALLFVSFSTIAADITVAGFAFSGDFKSAQSRFPYTYKLFVDKKGQRKSYSLLIGERSRNIYNGMLNFKTPESLVNLKSSDRALMAVLVLTGETVGVEEYGDYYKTFVNLRGDALIFDYKNQTVLRSYPLSVVIFDASADRPGAERIKLFVDDLIRRDDGAGLISQFNKRLEQATLPSEATKTVQVRKAEVSGEALAVFPDSLRKNPSEVEAVVRDSLASILSEKLGISMLPSSIGHAVGGVMSLRLENGEDYKLKVGEGDYLIDIYLNKFVKKKISENDLGSSYVYGAYAGIKIYEPALNTIYMESDLKNGETAVVPAGQVSVEDFPAYQDALRGMFLKFGHALQAGDLKWVEKAASEKNISSQIKKTQEMLRTCK